MLTFYILSAVLLHVYCEEEYTNKYDGVNLEEILASERLLAGYVNCLLDLGPCTPDAKELKKNLPDAIEHDCEKCTQRQREGADQVMHYIIDNRPDDWDKLEHKYNEDGSYKRKYLASKKTSHEDSDSDEKQDEDKTSRESAEKDKS